MHLVSSPTQVMDGNVRLNRAPVNTVMPMTSPGRQLRTFCEARWAELGRPRHGMVSELARESGVLRNTITNWFTKSSTPRLDALGDIARVLKVTRAELVAAFDGDELVSADRAREIVREELAAQAQAQPVEGPTPGRGGGRQGGSAPRRRSAA